MKNLEYLREKLHKALELGNPEDILRTSRELDKIICAYMQNNINLGKKTA